MSDFKTCFFPKCCFFVLFLWNYTLSEKNKTKTHPDDQRNSLYTVDRVKPTSSWVVMLRDCELLPLPGQIIFSPTAEGLTCPVFGRTKLRGALRMDEQPVNERLAGRTEFPPVFSSPFASSCQINDVWGKYYLFCFHCWFLSCPPLSCCLYLDDSGEKWNPGTDFKNVVTFGTDRLMVQTQVSQLLVLETSGFIGPQRKTDTGLNVDWKEKLTIKKNTSSVIKFCWWWVCMVNSQV